MGDHLLASVPNQGMKEPTVMRKLSSMLIQHGTVYGLSVPTNLVIGTLDSLISLSDELSRVDTHIENVVRKIAKQYEELTGVDAEQLMVGYCKPDDYVRQFEWDYAKYASRQPLQALVNNIYSSVNKIEEELKKLAMGYTEKTTAVNAFRRNKKSNLAVADLNEIITGERLQGTKLINTEYLKTLVIAVPKNKEATWLSSYEAIGSNIAALGNPDWSSSQFQQSLGQLDAGRHGPEFTERESTRGSPVVPASSVKILEDDETALYTVTILKGQYQAGFYDGDQFQPGMSVDYVEAFQKAAREDRYVVRPFIFNPEKASEIAQCQDHLQIEERQNHSNLTRWCKVHYGETLGAWLHLKVVSVFVESVLRYGLPIDFTTFLICPKRGKEAHCISILNEAYTDIVSVGPEALLDDDMKVSLISLVVLCKIGGYDAYV
eukprot:331828_1